MTIREATSLALITVGGVAVAAAAGGLAGRWAGIGVAGLEAAAFGVLLGVEPDPAVVVGPDQR